LVPDELVAVEGEVDPTIARHDGAGRVLLRTLVAGGVIVALIEREERDVEPPAPADRPRDGVVQGYQRDQPVSRGRQCSYHGVRSIPVPGHNAVRIVLDPVDLRQLRTPAQPNIAAAEPRLPYHLRQQVGVGGGQLLEEGRRLVAPLRSYSIEDHVAFGFQLRAHSPHLRTESHRGVLAHHDVKADRSEGRPEENRQQTDHEIGNEEPHAHPVGHPPPDPPSKRTGGGRKPNDGDDGQRSGYARLRVQGNRSGGRSDRHRSDD